MPFTQTEAIGIEIYSRKGLEAGVGDTPLIRLRNLTSALPPSVKLLIKANGSTPAVQSRIAPR